MGHRRYRLWSHLSVQPAHAAKTRAGFREVPFSDNFPGATAGIDTYMELTPDPKGRAMNRPSAAKPKQACVTGLGKPAFHFAPERKNSRHG